MDELENTIVVCMLGPVDGTAASMPVRQADVRV